MEVRKIYKDVLRALFVSFTVLLTVFNSCTSRYFLDLTSDVQLTKTFNTNKSTTVTNINCDSFIEEAVLTQHSNTTQIAPLAAFLIVFFSLSFYANSANKRFFPFSKEQINFLDTPFYILYNQRKILS